LGHDAAAASYAGGRVSAADRRAFALIIARWPSAASGRHPPTIAKDFPVRTHDIWSAFRDHFRSLDHLLVPGVPLPVDDPTLLFVSAGMVPLKPYFLGDATPPAPRVVSLQKCVRTTDIDAVGASMRYNTFFQMAGSFAFGDYFKREAITYAWSLLDTLGVDPDRIWVTVYADDDESFRLWRRIAGLPETRIQRLGRADNLWDMGVPGPCGPSSEIFVDRGPAYGPDGGPAVDTDRFMEIWNLVFMKDVRGEGGDGDFPIVGELPSRNIDTGMGLERTAVVLQGVDTVYDTDLVRPILDRAAELTGRRYGTDHDDDVRLRIVADHVRSAVMLVGDGVAPSTDGRGYVLRRLLRRAVRSIRLLGVDEPVLGELTGLVRDIMSPSYPSLVEDFPRIDGVIRTEEGAFQRTLANGHRVFERVAARSTGTLTGSDAFRLHDTHGVPIDLTLEMAAEAGLAVDEAGFRALMDAQRERARTARGTVPGTAA
jgi:alanyl-tRNA synthetase